MKLKLPFALKGGKLVEISQVQKGLDCNCTCPSCGAQLIARKGEHKVHHFAHKKKDCGSSLETSIHLAAKEILEKNKKIKLPSVETFIGAGSDRITLYKEQYLHFNNVFLEKRTNDIIPDVLIEMNGKELFIEIAVTHFIDESKREKLAKLNISTLEIDLSKIDKQITFQELELIVIERLDLKKWVLNTKVLSLKDQIDDFSREIWVGDWNNIYRCPLKKASRNKPYAELIYDCHHCPYLLSEKHDENGEGVTAINCVGHAKEQISCLIEIHKKS